MTDQIGVRARTSHPGRAAGSRFMRSPWLLLALIAGACSQAPEVHFHPPGAYPQRLSEWGVLVRDGDGYRLGAGMEPYEINSALFTDYALKLRAIYVPPGMSAAYRDQGPIDLPVGSIIAKTFFYPVARGTAVAADRWSGDPADLDVSTHRVMETRLLVRQPAGWDALPYVWNGTDAYLRVTGALEPIRLRIGENETELPYVVPSRNECAGCHATDHDSGALQPIGVQARHLNRSYPGREDNQLTAWAARGTLQGLPGPHAVPRTADWRDAALPLEVRARAYLDINCGHCHSATGAADTSGLLLDAATTDFRKLGFCKRPIAAGRGSGGRAYSIVPGEPDASILLFRMTTSDPAMRMPELGRTVPHAEAVELLRAWIAGLPGTCA